MPGQALVVGVVVQTVLAKLRQASLCSGVCRQLLDSARGPRAILEWTDAVGSQTLTQVRQGASGNGQLRSVHDHRCLTGL